MLLPGATSPACDHLGHHNVGRYRMASACRGEPGAKFFKRGPVCAGTCAAVQEAVNDALHLSAWQGGFS